MKKEAGGVLKLSSLVVGTKRVLSEVGAKKRELESRYNSAFEEVKADFEIKKSLYNHSCDKKVWE